MAKPVTAILAHKLGREEAVRRLRSGMGQLGTSLGMALKIEQHWVGDTLHFDAKLLGQAASGTIEVRESDVVITVLLPALLAAVAHRIVGKLKTNTTLLLDKK